MSQVTSTAPIALVRSGTYHLLALGFGYPSQECQVEFKRLLQQPELQAASGVDWSDSRESLENADQEALREEYQRLFDGKVACSPYESEWGIGNPAFRKGHTLADISGFYAAFGLGAEAAEPCDHLSLELEFMSVLALKEGYFELEEDAEGLEITIQAERDFLRDHLGRWLAVFCDRLEEETRQPYYLALALVARSFVGTELANYSIEPAPLVARRPEQSDELAEDCLSCPLASAEPQPDPENRPC